jgi:hypothetical protein
MGKIAPEFLIDKTMLGAIWARVLALSLLNSTLPTTKNADGKLGRDWRRVRFRRKRRWR